LKYPFKAARLKIQGLNGNGMDRGENHTYGMRKRAGNVQLFLTGILCTGNLPSRRIGTKSGGEEWIPNIHRGAKKI
jgi:hypothetical protein